jgi:hypothetical protein
MFLLRARHQHVGLLGTRGTKPAVSPRVSPGALHTLAHNPPWPADYGHVPGMLLLSDH